MAIPVNPDFEPGQGFDLGPYRVIPTLDPLVFPPTTYRNIGYDTSRILGINRGWDGTNKELFKVIHLGHPFIEADAEGVYHPICGYLLYVTDAFGVTTYSGYNLVWQYHVNSVTAIDGRIPVIQINLRIVKVHFEHPLDITVMANVDVGAGGQGGVADTSLDIVCCLATYDNHDWLGIGFGATMLNSSSAPVGSSYNTLAISEKFFSDNGWDNPEREVDDPNEFDPDGPSEPGGGDGDHRKIYTPIPVPGLPTIGPNSAGFVYMLRLSTVQMQDFASDMLSPSLWQAIKNFFADPMDFICGIMIVPYQPTSSINVKPKFGENVFDHAYPLVSQQYTEIDCGTLDITKYYGSCFDYNPYTQLIVWLPYIGYRNLDPDEVMGTTIRIKYHCDCMTGDCVCFISAIKDGVSRVIAQYSGNCGVRVPFGSNSFDSTVSASVQLLGGAVGAIAGGALAGPAGIAAGEITASQISNSVASTTVSSVNAVKSKSERSGVAGACAGYLSIQTPYLLRIIPRQSLPKNYQDLEGYPSNISGNVGEFSGFLAVETIKLKVAATSTEKDMIMQLLKGGIYV